MDLGMKYDIGLMSAKDISKETHYPTVRLETNEPLDIPDGGTVTFKFVKKSSEWRKKDDGKKRYECCLKLTELVKSRKTPVKSEGKKLAYEETEDALDKLAAEAESED